MLIQIRLKDGYSLRAIARELTCSPTTIFNEIKRGFTLLYNGTKDGIRPPGGRRSMKRTERPPAVISHYSYLDNRACGKEVLFHRAVPWCLRGQCSYIGRL